MKQTLLLSAAITFALIPQAIRAQVLEERPKADQPKSAPADPVRDDRSTAPGDNRPKPDTREDRPTEDSSATAAQHRRASQIIGMNIHNMQSEKVGAIEDLVLDLSARRVTAIVISSGGFLGIADELSIVPPSALKFNSEGDAFTANLTKDQLTNAPRFQGTKYPDLNDPKYILDLYKAYEAEPYLESIDADDDADGRVRRVLRASELLGMVVKNHQDDTLGDINEIILNASLDRVSSFVVSSGGFLGIGDTLSVLPAEAVTPTKDAVLVNATKATLEKSPRFTADAWPERMNDPSYLVDVYAPYQFRSDTESDVDINASTDQRRDEAKKDAARKDRDSVNALDQSNNPGDVALTTNIRRRLVSRDDLSFSAKNIRVVTIEGKVTLVGEVASQEEMDAILKIAGDESGADRVVNRMTVEKD